MIVTRAQWGAQPPQAHIPAIGRQDTVFVHHTVLPDAPPTISGAAAVRAVRDTQALHLRSGWADIGYTLVVDDEGVIYVARGWGLGGGHTFGHNLTSYAVATLGNTDRGSPSPAALRGIAAAIRWGIRDGWLTPDCRILGHRDANATACPGSHLHAALPAIRTLVASGGTDTGDDDDMTPEQAAQLARIEQWMRDNQLAYPALLPDGTPVGQHYQNLYRALVGVEEMVPAVRSMTAIGPSLAHIARLLEALPTQVATAVLDALKATPPPEPPPPPVRTHTVRAGETLWGIAKLYATTPERIVAANPSIQPPAYVIAVGQVLTIPEAAS